MADSPQAVPMNTPGGESSGPEAPRSPAASGGETAQKHRPAPADRLGFADSIFLAIENPVLRRELLTSLRSNKAFVLQFIFLLVLGAVVYRAFPEQEVGSLSAEARTLFRIF